MTQYVYNRVPSVAYQRALISINLTHVTRIFFILYYDQQMHSYFTNYHTVTFCTVTNKCTVISQIITLSHFALWPTNAQLFYKLSHYYILHCDQQMHSYFTNYHTIIFLHCDQQMHSYFTNYHTITFCTMTSKCTIISQIITLLHVALDQQMLICEIIVHLLVTVQNTK